MAIPKTTSEKLNALAVYIETHPKRFNQRNKESCKIGLGLRLDDSYKRLSRVSYDGLALRFPKERILKDRHQTAAEQAFAKRYGVTWKQAESLNLAAYHRLKIGVSGGMYLSDVTASDAANVLRKLAAKYAKAGN